MTNINWDAITDNTKAAGRAAATFALSLDGVPGRDKTTVNPKSKRAIARSIIQLAQLEKAIDKVHSCSHDETNLI